MSCALSIAAEHYPEIIILHYQWNSQQESYCTLWQTTNITSKALLGKTP